MLGKQGNNRPLMAIGKGLGLLEGKRWPILTLFCLVHILILVLVFPHGGPDVEGYYHYATQVAEGQIPYRDFEVEYPPGAVIVFLLPRLFADSLEVYGDAFSICMLAFDLISLLCAVRLGRHIGLSAWKVALAYTLAMLAIGPIMVQRYDLAPTALTLLALLFFCEGREGSAWAWLSLGIMTKIYPAVLAPLFFIHHLKHKEPLIDALTVFIIVTLAVGVPFLIIGGEGFIQAFTMQGGRDLQVESTYASILLLLQTLGIGTAQVYQGRSSLDVEAPLSGPLGRYSMVITAVLLIVAYIQFWRHYNRAPGPSRPNVSALVNSSLLGILILLITSKVFSPQFIIWLLPLVALAGGRFRKAVVATFIVAAGLSYYIYPTHYGELIDMQPLAISILAVRNLMVIALAVLVGLELHRARLQASQGQEGARA